MEEWLPVRDCGEYAVSDEGRVFSWKNNQYLLPHPTNNSVVLLHRGWTKTVRIATIVLEAFNIPRDSNSWVPIHRNSLGQDNRLCNLYWGTPRDAAMVAVKSGRIGNVNQRRRALEHAALPPSMDDVFEKREWE